MPLPSPSIPEGMDLIESFQGSRIIRRRWLSWMVVPLLIFAAFWNGFLFFFYRSMFSGSHTPPLVAALFPLIHVAVGIGMAYYAIASLFNKTDVIMSDTELQVRIGPVPWLGSKIVSRQEMAGLVTRARSRQRGATTYSVYYVDPTRKERKLVSGFPHPEQAEFVEETIRQAFGLPEA